MFLRIIEAHTLPLKKCPSAFKTGISVMRKDAKKEKAVITYGLLCQHHMFAMPSIFAPKRNDDKNISDNIPKGMFCLDKVYHNFDKTKEKKRHVFSSQLFYSHISVFDILPSEMNGNCLLIFFSVSQ